MKNILIAVLLSVMACVGCMAQNTKANGRKLFQQGDYEAAKPVFAHLLKNSPKNAEYNYWYAACCYETKDTIQGIEKMLQFAASRRVLNAPYYLAKLYKDSCRYVQSIEQYEKFLSDGKDEKRMAAATTELEHVKELLRMMKNTEQVIVVDSIIVDKKDFLSAYRAGKDVGFLAISDVNRGRSANSVRTVQMPDSMEAVDEMYHTLFVTELGTDQYHSGIVTVDSVELYKIFHAKKDGDDWGHPQQIAGFETMGNDAYPFMSADGTTFYFASDGDGSIGGYDIFVTSYDNETGRFLRPSNVGMPFNSEANDYMMVINEIANLGWFATDRGMLQGKVCIYVFIPNEVKRTYNYEQEDYERMVCLSGLTDISATQHDDEALRKARQQLTMLMYEQNTALPKHSFSFVIDDFTDYNSLADFKNKDAREMFSKWQKRTAKYNEDLNLLENRRLRYASENAASKQRSAKVILAEERRLEEEKLLIDNMEKEIRVLEHKSLRK